MIFTRIIFLGLMSLGALLGPVSSFSQSLDFDASVSTDLKAQVLGDFQFLSSVASSKVSPLHQEIFGQVQGADYLRWFNARVFKFAVSTCGGAGSVACQEDKFPNQIFVTSHYVLDGYPQVARLMTLFHEARHNEIKYNHWPHKLCSAFFKPRSIWTGATLSLHSACDNTPYGSYGCASIMLNNISKFCTTCNSKVKSDAKLYSDDQIKRITNAAARTQINQDFSF